MNLRSPTNPTFAASIANAWPKIDAKLSVRTSRPLAMSPEMERYLYREAMMSATSSTDLMTAAKLRRGV